jgi:flagellar biosynthesis/type III secretory pathway ATPase
MVEVMVTVGVGERVGVLVGSGEGVGVLVGVAVNGKTEIAPTVAAI